MATTKKSTKSTSGTKRTTKKASTRKTTAAKTTAKSTSKTTNASKTTAAKSKNSRTKCDKEVVTVDRRAAKERRSATDRRQKSEPVAVERRTVERRAKVNRRRQIDPTTCERDYTPDEVEFMNAMDDYKRSSGRMFPTCSEILEVIKKLGYEKCLHDPANAVPVAELPTGLFEKSSTEQVTAG